MSIERYFDKIGIGGSIFASLCYFGFPAGREGRGVKRSWKALAVGAAGLCSSRP